MSRIPMLIVGGGLSGTLLAGALVERGVAPAEICVLDAGGRVSVAESAAAIAPVAILHPFPGWHLDFKRGAKPAFEAANRLLARWQERYGERLVQRRAMIRPLHPDFGGDKMRASWEAAQDGYPDWVRSEIVDRRALDAVAPALVGVDEAVRYEPAWAVNLAVLGLERERLADAGVRQIEGHARRFERQGDGWRVECDADAVEAERVVLCVGAGLGELFPSAGIRGRGGEVLAVEPPAGVRLDDLVSAGGLVTPFSDDYWIIGSSWFPADELDERTDADAEEAVRGRATRFIPALSGARLLAVFRGVRTTHPSDRHPLVGPVPGQQGLYVVGALGSKGLLWGPQATAWLAGHLTGDQTPIPTAMDAARKAEGAWASDKLG